MATSADGDIRRPTFADVTIDYVGFLAGIVSHAVCRQMSVGECRRSPQSYVAISRCRYLTVVVVRLHSQLSRRQMSVGECRYSHMSASSNVAVLNCRIR